MGVIISLVLQSISPAKPALTSTSLNAGLTEACFSPR
jgi:hypothetical protein